MIIENERRKKAIETMNQINKDNKEDIVFFGNEVEDQEIISTGISNIDNFLGGGIKRGTHTIAWGGYSAGKTTLALQTIGHAQKQGLICAYINLEKPVDKERFITMGVDLNNLIRSDCTKNAEQALTVIKKLCQAKVIDLIVIDSIQALSPKAENENKGKERELDEKTMGELARTMSEFCRRVNPDIYRAKAGVLWIGQVRLNIGSFFTGASLTGGEAIKFYAYQIVYMRKGQSSNAPVRKFKNYFVDPDGKIRFKTEKEPIGFDAVFKMDKTNNSKSVKEKQEQNFAFLFDNGFVSEVIESEDVPIKIDPECTEEQKQQIKEYLIEKKSDEAKQLGLVDKPTEPEPPELRELHEGSETPVVKKKGRGRPKKEKK